MPRDCGELKLPEPPELDTSKLPDGVNLPDGMSVDGLKAKAQNPGFSDRLKNAGSAIGENIKNTLDQLNPASIAEQVGAAVTGMVNVWLLLEYQVS